MKFLSLIFFVLTTQAFTESTAVASSSTSARVFMRDSESRWSERTGTLVIVESETTQGVVYKVYLGTAASRIWSFLPVASSTFGFSNTVLTLANRRGVISLPSGSNFAENAVWNENQRSTILRDVSDQIGARSIDNIDLLAKLREWEVPNL